MIDAKKRQLSKLEMILLDEISMAKSDLIYQLDLRLQEIKGKPRVPFGGVSILCFGDILQLCPVMGKFAFEEPKNPSFKVTYYLDSRWEKMKHTWPQGEIGQKKSSALSVNTIA